MKIWDFISKYWFGIFLVLYLLLRDYPFGSTSQTISDILMLVTVILTIISWVVSKKANQVKKEIEELENN
ncbi:hypothetical protein CHH53_14585 [Terribacillus sp. 7520-G]|nr:hypothetical protein CHH53_14585 [Terribacillus sp. 7520-G]